MRRFFLTLIVVAVLPTSAARASGIELITSVDEEGGFPTLAFGTDPASGNFSFIGMIVDGQRIFPGAPDYFDDVTGDVTFSTGALLDLEVLYDEEGNPTESFYDFGAGAFSFTAFWTTPDGSTASGGFSARLDSLWVSVCEGCDRGDSSYGEFAFFLSGGILDRALARVLEVPKTGWDGQVGGAIDLITGDPTDAVRLGGAQTPWNAELVSFSVPEPGLGILLLTAAAVFGIRRRRYPALATAKPMTAANARPTSSM